MNRQWIHSNRVQTKRQPAVQCRQGKWSCFVSVEYIDGICFLPLSDLLVDDVSWLYATWNLTLVSTCSTSMMPPELDASFSSWQSDSTNHEPRDVVRQLWRPAPQQSTSLVTWSANCDHLHHNKPRASWRGPPTVTTCTTTNHKPRDVVRQLDDLHHDGSTMLLITHSRHLYSGSPLWRQYEIPWWFMALLRGVRHIKCYSYHARTSVTVSGGGRNATVHDPKPYMLNI